MQEWLTHAIANYPVLVYGIIIIVSFVEGPILAVLCGVLYHLGLIYIVPVYFSLMAGDLIGDCFWYWIGYHFGHRFIERFGKYFSIHEKNVNKVSKIFHSHRDTILIVSKLTMGFGFALVTLVTAGLVKIPFRKYITLNATGQFVWTAILLSIGYLFGNVYTSIDNIAGKISLVALFILLFAGLIGYGKFVRRKMSLEDN